MRAVAEDVGLLDGTSPYAINAHLVEDVAGTRSSPG
jgi:hypothetical protein